MNTFNFLGHSIMKPTSRILLGCRFASFVLPPPKCHLNFLAARGNSGKLGFNFEQFKTSPFRILGLRPILEDTQKAFWVPSWTFGQSGVVSRPNCSKSKGLFLDACVASRIRSFSTSVENRVNESNFERIYVQGGLNVKPLVIERIDKDDNVVGRESTSSVEAVGGKANTKDQEGLSEPEVKGPKRMDPDAENEAWRFLRDSVVTYCGSPVGTMAANDPNDKQPLNYDQVFIRDFVPSALAFLLKGEGEIVRNFLLHTLQLQTWITTKKKKKMMMMAASEEEEGKDGTSDLAQRRR